MEIQAIKKIVKDICPPEVRYDIGQCCPEQALRNKNG